MKAASEHLTPVTLELGGKSPCIVDETADIARPPGGLSGEIFKLRTNLRGAGLCSGPRKGKGAAP